MLAQAEFEEVDQVLSALAWLPYVIAGAGGAMGLLGLAMVFNAKWRLRGVLWMLIGGAAAYLGLGVLVEAFKKLG